MATRSSLPATKLLGSRPNSPTSTAALSTAETATTDTANHSTVDSSSVRSSCQIQDYHFILAVVITVTAILLPVFASISVPIVKDCVVSLDASSWTISTTFVFSRDYYLTRSRLLRNVIVTTLAFTLFAWGFRATLSDAFVWLPLAVNVAVVINAQEPPWTCTRRRRQTDDLLPMYNHQSQP